MKLQIGRPNCLAYEIAYCVAVSTRGIWRSNLTGCLPLLTYEAQSPRLLQLFPRVFLEQWFIVKEHLALSADWLSVVMCSGSNTLRCASLVRRPTGTQVYGSSPAHKQFEEVPQA